MQRHEPPGRAYPRMPPTRAQNDTPIGDENWLREAVTRFDRSLSDLTTLIEDTSHRVDEFQNLPTTGAPNVTQIQTFPDYDIYAEIIESVVVTGPAGTAYTLQLGKRIWTLQMPAAGIYVIAPLKLSLDRDDARILTSNTAGDWTLELMGYADIRYRYK